MGMRPGAWGYEVFPGFVSESDLLGVSPVEIRSPSSVVRGAYTASMKSRFGLEAL